MNDLATDNYLSDVRDQYESLPYPLRNPEDERQRLLQTYGDALDYLTHHAFGGHFDPDGFDVLIAGGGTGDGTIYLAEQLREWPCRIVHLDLSETSISIAKQRAAIRNLDSIEFIHGSLLDLPTMDIGTFRYINSIGVLHHLSSPDDGLKALKSVLRADGLMNIMVYGQFGRTYIYHMQELMRMMNKTADSTDQKIANCQAIMEAAKRQDWMRILHAITVDEINENGDIGIYDLFLHSQDRAYTVADVYAWLDRCELEHGRWLYQDINYVDLFSLDTITDPELRTKLEAMPTRDREAIMEYIKPYPAKHTFYACHAPLQPLPSPKDEQMVPKFLSYFPNAQQELISKSMPVNGEYQRATLTSRFLTCELQMSAVKEQLIYAIDGKRSIAEMLDLVVQKCTVHNIQVNRLDIMREWKEMYAVLEKLAWIGLRHYSSPPLLNHHELQERTIEQYGMKT